MSSNTRDELLAEMINGLTIEERAPFALSGLETLTKENEEIIRELVSNRSRVLINLLSLTESPDEQLASRAEVVKETIDSILTGDPVQISENSMTRLVHDGLSDAKTDSVT